MRRIIDAYVKHIYPHRSLKNNIKEEEWELVSSLPPNPFDKKKVLILTPFYRPNKGGAETFADER